MIKPHGAGKSSLDLVDFNAFLALFGPAPDAALLDLGCGRGAWTLALAQRLPGCLIHAVDAWEEGIGELQASAHGLDRIRPAVAWAHQLPLDDGAVDAAFMATVFHDIDEDQRPAVAAELRRVLRPGGRLCLVEFKVMEGPPGPPRNIRLGPQDLDAALAPAGFVKGAVGELGPHAYAALFTVP